jgi:hypothetical protein
LTTCIASRFTNHAAEIAALVSRFLIGNHVGFEIPAGALRLALDAGVEGLDDGLLEA